jgi:hypothetical protein
VDAMSFTDERVDCDAGSDGELAGLLARSPGEETAAGQSVRVPGDMLWGLVAVVGEVTHRGTGFR